MGWAAALVLITPAYDPDTPERGLDRWDALAGGLREGGVEGFIAAYGEPRVPESFRGTVKTVLEQRLSAHEHPDAVADALEQVPRSHAFDSWDALATLETYLAEKHTSASALVGRAADAMQTYAEQPARGNWRKCVPPGVLRDL